MILTKDTTQHIKINTILQGMDHNNFIIKITKIKKSGHGFKIDFIVKNSNLIEKGTKFYNMKLSTFYNMKIINE